MQSRSETQVYRSPGKLLGIGLLSLRISVLETDLFTYRILLEEDIAVKGEAHSVPFCSLVMHETA